MTQITTVSYNTMIGFSEIRYPVYLYLTTKFNYRRILLTNRKCPNRLWPLCQSESWCSCFHMKISFYSNANENKFSDERISTRTLFEKEVKGNSEVAYQFQAAAWRICCLIRGCNDTPQRSDKRAQLGTQLGQHDKICTS